MNSQSAQFWRRHLEQKVTSCSSPIQLMEVCGTHTHAVARYNLRELLPGNVTLVSGPGCPVCVSGALFIEKIRLLLRQNVTVALFGDLLRIPGSAGTLRGEKNLHIVYSPADALDFALENPQQQVVFAAVGFAPTLGAAAALMADVETKEVRNFSILSDFKEIMPVLHTLCAQSRLSGFLLPGHVASITGVQHFAGLPVPGVVAGFEPENILHALSLLLEAIVSGKNDFLANDYPEAVRDNGNQAALQLIDRFFDFGSGFWRGLGEIPRSRRTLKGEFAYFDAEKRFDLTGAVCTENPLCRCGEVLTGKIPPEKCPLFGKVCTPETPEGACMASPEGSCAAVFQWKGGAL